MYFLSTLSLYPYVDLILSYWTKSIHALWALNVVKFTQLQNAMFYFIYIKKPKTKDGVLLKPFHESCDIRNWTVFVPRSIVDIQIVYTKS
jgi:hypothetical protein